MFNLKQVTVDSKEAYGKDFQGLFNHAKHSDGTD